jgi:hypothetical protein
MKSAELMRLLVLTLFLDFGPYKPPLVVRVCPNYNTIIFVKKHRLHTKLSITAVGLNFLQLHKPPLVVRVYPNYNTVSSSSRNTVFTPSLVSLQWV